MDSPIWGIMTSIFAILLPHVVGMSETSEESENFTDRWIISDFSDLPTVPTQS
jgi:hypothetical protein